MTPYLRSMRHRSVIGLLLLVVLGGTAGPAHARQLVARDAPEVSGPLRLASKDCARKTKTFEGDTVAVGKFCLRFYSFNPAREGNARRDFGVVWVQANVNPRAGWCATTVRSDVELPGRLRLHARAPHRSSTTRRDARTVRLHVDAAGAARREGLIKQRYIAYPKSIRTRVSDRGRLFRLRWRGSSARNLGFASGIEVSWNAEKGLPGGIVSALRYGFEKSDSC